MTNNKLERHNKERFGEDGTYLGRSSVSSSQQTRMASECGLMPSRCGMNQGRGQINETTFRTVGRKKIQREFIETKRQERGAEDVEGQEWGRMLLPAG